MISHIKSLISWPACKRGILLGLISLIGSFVFAMSFFGKTVLNKYQLFLQTANLTHREVVELIKTATQAQPIDQLTLLILGTDQVENRSGFPQLSDSIILARVKPSHNQTFLLSLPRDLWSDDYQTKINALYQYGRDQNPEQPTQFPQQVVGDLTQQPIDHTLVLSLTQLESLIQIIGTIEIDVPIGFTDHQFPRSDVDITTEMDPNKLYESVTFVAGKQQMDGEQALKYIRSRHSSDPLVGTDLDRSLRQQQVIEALLNRLLDIRQYWYEPQTAGRLYSFYQENFSSYLSIPTLTALAVQMHESAEPLVIKNTSLSIYPGDPLGVIEHPQTLKPYQNQWVYIIRDQSQFRQFVSKALAQ